MATGHQHKSQELDCCILDRFHPGIAGVKALQREALGLFHAQTFTP
jgi:hypothetical protein